MSNWQPYLLQILRILADTERVAERTHTYIRFYSHPLCSHGMSRSGTEYGALVDLPDWSYVGRFAIADIFVDWTLIACFHPDGRPAPITKNQQFRLRKQYAIRVCFVNRHL